MPSHKARCTLAYTPVQLFEIAADVECYPEFLPGCFATRVTKRDGNVYYSDQIVGFGVFRKRFGTKTVLERPERIVVISSDRLFRNFELIWRFDPLPGSGCQVTLLVELEFRSGLARELFSRAVIRGFGPIMSAFEARADRLYGPRASQHSAAGESGSGGPAARGGD